MFGWIHRCRSKQIFGVAKDFAQIFPNLSKKLSCNFCRSFLWCDLNKNGLHLFFCEPWAPFFEAKQRWASFFPRFSRILPTYIGLLFGFSEILPRFSGILPRFSGILPGFSGILPGFSTNQNFWGYACTPCTPASYTTGWIHFAIQYKWYDTCHTRGRSKGAIAPPLNLRKELCSPWFCPSRKTAFAI